MKKKRIIKNLIIISIIILMVGAILGFGIRVLMLNYLAEQNIPSQNPNNGIGGDYSSLINMFGHIFSFTIGIGIFIISSIIVFIIWIVYGIIRFIEKRKQ